MLQDKSNSVIFVESNLAFKALWLETSCLSTYNFIIQSSIKISIQLNLQKYVYVCTYFCNFDSIDLSVADCT